jgi:putative ABC transport system permease protein
MTIWRDLRFGFRLLARNPSYSIAALAVMALGIGATTAVFSVVRAVLLQPLPYREPDRLVLFRADGPGVARQALLTSYELEAIRARPDLFESVAVIGESEGNLTSPDDMEAVPGASASENFFETLGVKPLLGRAVSRVDFGVQWVTGVDISYELWQRRWQGDPAVVGKPIEVNNIPMTVIGVMPRGFRVNLGPGVVLPTRIDVWYPRGAGYDVDPARSHIAIARLKAGVAVAAAQSAVDGVVRQVAAAHAASYSTGPVRLSLAPLDREVVSDAKPALLALMGAVAFVLLVACANLMNLLLARACARTRELAVRAAVGASRGQLVAQLAAESAVLGILGAGLGLIVAQWGVDILLRLAPATLPRRETIAVDAGVALFAVAVSLACSVVFGLVPAWQATSADVIGSLKQDPSSARHSGTTRGLLVAAQLALSLTLLVGAGLMMRAFVSMRSVPLGFDPSRAITMNVHLQKQRFSGDNNEDSKVKRLAFYRRLVDTVRQIPGVERAGAGLFVPLSGGPIPRRVAEAPGRPDHPVAGAIALAGFLESLKVPLAAGRYFTPDDDNRPVVIVDRTLAEELWRGAPAIGRQMQIADALGRHPVEVVGVVQHVQLEGLRTPGLPEVFMTYASSSYSDLNIVVRGANPMALVAPVEAAVQQMGPGRPVHDVRALEDYVDDASADTRFALFVLGVFAALAVVLTAVGVYGVVAYATARRTREIAVRRALGADATTIVALVVRDGAGWTIAGLAVGAAGARLLTRYLESLLFQVKPNDPATVIGVAVLLSAVAFVATVLPALRAVRVDPMLALRTE